MTPQTRPVWQHATTHRLRGRINLEDLNTSCDNQHCTDPAYDDTYAFVSADGTVLQNLKSPHTPDACPSCYESTNTYDPYEDYWDDDSYTDEYEERRRIAMTTNISRILSGPAN